MLNFSKEWEGAQKDAQIITKEKGTPYILVETIKIGPESLCSTIIVWYYNVTKHMVRDRCAGIPNLSETIYRTLEANFIPPL